MTDTPATTGVDVEATVVTVGLVGADGKVASRLRVLTPKRLGSIAVVDVITHLVGEAPSSSTVGMFTARYSARGPGHVAALNAVARDCSCGVDGHRVTVCTELAMTAESGHQSGEPEADAVTSVRRERTEDTLALDVFTKGGGSPGNDPGRRLGQHRRPAGAHHGWSGSQPISGLRARHTSSHAPGAAPGAGRNNRQARPTRARRHPGGGGRSGPCGGRSRARMLRMPDVVRVLMGERSATGCHAAMAVDRGGRRRVAAVFLATVQAAGTGGADAFTSRPTRPRRRRTR